MRTAAGLAFDATGRRLCGMVNGTVVGAVLPSAQFCNTLTHSVLRLYRKDGVAPYALHATWMRQQREEFKVMRLREEMAWKDRRSWYGAPSRRQLAARDTPRPLPLPATALTLTMGELGAIDPVAGFLLYEPRIPTALLRTQELHPKGGIPVHHLTLMFEQIRQLRNGFFLARALGRSLILPRTYCTCEMGFFPYHIGDSCRAPDHPTLRLPHLCAIDHYLEPVVLAKSPFLHRERSFLDNPRTPKAQLMASSASIRVCNGGGRDGGRHPELPACDGLTLSPGEVALPAGLSIERLRAKLGSVEAKLMRVDDVLGGFGGFEQSTPNEAVQFHEDMQALLSSWCCTIDARFKRVAGVIPYILPPLEGQTEWSGSHGLAWAAQALADIFDNAGDTARARLIRPALRK